jgi:hypothetical protein
LARQFEISPHCALVSAIRRAASSTEPFYTR